MFGTSANRYVRILPPRTENRLGEDRAREVFKTFEGTPVYTHIIVKDGYSSLKIPTEILRSELANNPNVRAKFKKLKVCVEEVVKTKFSSTYREFRSAVLYANDIAEQNRAQPITWRFVKGFWSLISARLSGAGPSSAAAALLIVCVGMFSVVAYKVRQFGLDYSNTLEKKIIENSRPYRPRENQQQPATSQPAENQVKILP